MSATRVRNLAWQPRFEKERFVITFANLCAYRVAAECPKAWGDEPVQLIVGPEGCGKSHLAAIYEETTAAARIVPARLPRDAWDAFNPRDAFLIDGAESVTKGRDGEVGFQHFLDRLRGAKGRLLLTARAPPQEWGCRLPDLTTRLTAAPSARVVEPDDALLEGVLAKLFADRQLQPGNGVLAWLLRHVERSYAAAVDVVERLDSLSLETGRELRLPLVVEVLEQR